MATYFWVGGNGNWSATDTTNWATSSGGSGGAGVPTSADNVIFDANSNVGTGAFTVTVTGTSASPAVCNDFSTGGAGGALDGAMTLTMGATAFLDVYGSMTLPATNFSISGTAGANIRYRATTTGKTITTNGVSFGSVAVVFNGSGGGWTLGSAFTSSQFFTIDTGSVNTGNFNVTADRLLAGGTNTRTITLGSSTLTFVSASAVTLNATGLTFDAGTSTIVCSLAASPTFAGGGLTFYNVSFTSTSSGTVTITGANTFNDLTFTSLAATGIRNISVGANQTVNGTLTFGTANTAIRRMFMYSDVVGTSRTITLNGSLATLADVDFRDITAAGTVGTWSGTRLGNCLGNSNITFDAGKTVYRVGTGNWSATQWSLSSGGSVNVNNFPLAQDTAVFDTGTTTGTHTIDGSWNIGTLNMAALNVAVTLATGATSPNIFGNVTLDADVTLTGTGAIGIVGISNQTFTSSSKTWPQPLIVNKPTTSSLLLGDALTTSATFTLTQGTLDLNNFDLTCGFFASANSNTRSITFGTNKILVTGNGATVFDMATVTNFTFTGSGRFDFTYSGSVGTRIIGGPTAYAGDGTNLVNIYVTAGTDIVSLAGVRSYNTIDFTGFSGTLSNTGTNLFGNLVISSGMTLASGTNLLSILNRTGTNTITSNGKTFDFPVTKTTGAATVGVTQLLDNLTMGGTRTLTHSAGTLDLNDFDLTTGLYSSTGSATRQLDFGTGDLNITGASFTASGSNFTTAGTGSVSMNSASSKTFAGGGFSYKVLNQGGAGELIITGTNTFTNITNTNATASTITFPNVTTTVSDFTVSGSAGNLVTLRRTGASGTFTLNYTGASATFVDYVSISNSTATPSSKFYAGVNSTDGGGNTGWTFNYTPATMYWVNGSGTWSATSKTNWAAFSGSAGGNVVPTSSTNVIFDTNSDSGSAFTVTIDNGVCNNLDASAINQIMTIDYNSKVLSVYGTTFTGASTGLIAKTGTGYIDMISASNKTFAGGGNIYGKIRNAGAGDLTITGANTFDDIANSTQPCTIKLPSGVVTKVVDFNLNGTFGNYVTLKSTTDGVQATLEYI